MAAHTAKLHPQPHQELPPATSKAEGCLQLGAPSGAQIREEACVEPGSRLNAIWAENSRGPVPRSWSRKFVLGSSWYIPLSSLIPHHMARTGSSRPRTRKQEPFGLDLKVVLSLTNFHPSHFNCASNLLKVWSRRSLLKRKFLSLNPDLWIRLSGRCFQESTF